jgi:hypothetical protein
MSINFENPMNDEARSMLKSIFADNIEAMDDKTALLRKMVPLHQKQMGDLARTAKQVVDVEINEIGDRKEVGGVVYELDEAGWKRLPIGSRL